MDQETAKDHVNCLKGEGGARLMEGRRFLHSPRPWLAAAVGMLLTGIGLHQYASISFQNQVPSAWIAMGYSTAFIPPLLPLVGAIGFGDGLAQDLENGYLPCLIVRMGLTRTLWRRGVATFFASGAVLMLSLIPAAIISVLAFPVQRGRLIGALQGFAAPDWLFTLANVGTLLLAEMAWTTVAVLVTPLLVRRYWVQAVPLLTYLILAVAMAPPYNPMRRSELWYYVPTLGPYWTDAALWALFLLLGAAVAIVAWARRGDVGG